MKLTNNYSRVRISAGINNPNLLSSALQKINALKNRYDPFNTDFTSKDVIAKLYHLSQEEAMLLFNEGFIIRDEDGFHIDGKKFNYQYGLYV